MHVTMGHMQSLTRTFQRLATFLLPVMILVLVNVGCRPSTEPPASPDPNTPPNILIILTDDQRYDTMHAMPITQARIFDEGVTFTSAYISTPTCCPSRAALMTGQYARHNCVLRNTHVLDEPTLVTDLHNAGYYTGVIGKYLNSYPVRLTDPPVEAFDFWVVSQATKHTQYINPHFMVGEAPIQHEGYTTEVTRDYALQFFDEAADTNQPFFMLYAPIAPHNPAIPAEEDADLFTDGEPHRPPAFNEEDISDKPAEMRELAPLSDEEIAQIDEFRLDQLQALPALDRAIESMLDHLEASGQLDNTLIIYLSDNGMFWGEHRLWIGRPGGAKDKFYEESTHVPFAIRYPSLIDTPREEDRLVANIDIAPTLYEIVGLPVPDAIDGRSLLPLLNDTADTWRDFILLESWARMPYAAVHTGRYVYAETDSGERQFYDLQTDPYQQDNQVDHSQYADTIAEMDAWLAELQAEPLTCDLGRPERPDE